MVVFKPIDPNQLNNLRQGRKGKVAYPIIKAFMESNQPLAMLDRKESGITRTISSLTVGLSTYIKNHELPIKVFQRQGELYLMRLDLDGEGNPIEEWNAESTIDEVVEGL